MRDGFKATDSWCDNNIKWLEDLQLFYHQRAEIEREYATKLKNLCSELFKKKAAKSTQVLVGDHPVVTPGSLESALLVMWTEVLTQTETIAKHHSQFLGELSTQVAGKLGVLQSSTEAIHQRLVQFHQALLDDRERTYTDVSKSKSHYDRLCEAMESARARLEKHLLGLKYQQRAKEKEVEMNEGKNVYLLKINVANRIKDKFFYQDLPEILDQFQDLSELRCVQMNNIVQAAGVYERRMCKLVTATLDTISEVVEQNSPQLDLAMFIKHNLLDWKEPEDFVYVPLSIWHDDEEMVVKEPELSKLKQILNQSVGLYDHYTQATNNEKQLLEELMERKKKLLQQLDASTRDIDATFRKLLTQLQAFVLDDSKRVQAQVEIETIQNYAGDQDLTYVATNPVKKGMFHSLGKVLRGETLEDVPLGALDTLHLAAPQRTNTVLLQFASARHDNASSHGGGGGLLGGLLRRGTLVASHSQGGTVSARALYPYTAAGDDEVLLAAEESLTVTQLDDGSGWTMVSKLDGLSGLVPTSYLEIGVKKRGPSVAPRRGAKKVEYAKALYDYNADGDDEMSLQAGDRVVILEHDDGGWTKGEFNGVLGLFPTSYVELL